MACPKTRNFSAWMNLIPESEKIIVVQGEVETNSSNIHPKLTMAVPQGFNPQVLVLDLDLEKSDDLGSQDVNYRKARFEKQAESGQYTHIEIMSDGDSCLTLDVTEAH